MVRRWHVGLRREGPVCWGVRLLVGCGSSAKCPIMFGVLVWFDVGGGRPRWRGFRIRRCVLVGRWLGIIGMYEVCGGAL